MTTSPPSTTHNTTLIFRALIWKAWQESRDRFVSACILINGLVLYAVLTSPGYISRHNTHSPDNPLFYSVYIWSGLFNYALQALRILSAFVLALGGLARERASGVALFTLGLPVRRSHLFLVRAAMAAAQSILLGIIAALLIPPLSALVGESYPLSQSLAFGSLMSSAGLLILAIGLLLSEVFEGEFTAPVLGLTAIAAIFLSYKAHVIPGWNLFNVMSAATSIDPVTQTLTGPLPWTGLLLALAASLILLSASIAVIRTRDI